MINLSFLFSIMSVFITFTLWLKCRTLFEIIKHNHEDIEFLLFVFNQKNKKPEIEDNEKVSIKPE